MMGQIVTTITRSIVQTVMSGGRGPRGATGAGANVLAAGLKINANGMSVAATTDSVITTGYQVAGIGSALYAYDATKSGSYVTANPEISFAAADGRIFVLSAAQVVTPAMFGAFATAGSDDGPAFERMFAFVHQAAGHARLDRTYYVLSGRTVTGRQISLAGSPSGLIQFNNSGALNFVNCSGLATDVSVRGALTSTVQYGLAKSGIADAFASGVTYNDGTDPSQPNSFNTLDGSDFTHPIVGTVLSITPPATATGIRQARNVVSGKIALDAAKRYVVKFGDGFFNGDGGNQPIIRLYDSGGAFLRVFVPSDSSQNGSRTAMIYGAASMTVQVGAYRDYNTTLGLTAKWDLSKFMLYEVMNDLAAQDMMTSPGDSGHIYMNGCQGMRWTGGYGTMINRSVIKMIGCSDCEVSGVKLAYVLQGVTDDNGTRNNVVRNIMDLRLDVQGGGRIGSRAFRLRGIGGGGASDGCSYSFNTIVGPSWTIEVLPNLAGGRNYAIGNRLVGEFCGLSLPNTHWTASDNTIDLESDAIYGIENPGNGDLHPTLTASGNVIRWRDFSGYIGFGYSCSNNAGATITGGYVRAPFGGQNPGTAGGTIRIEGTVFDVGSTVWLGRDGPVSARFGEIGPALFDGVRKTILPYGSVTSASLMDIGVAQASYRIRFAASHVRGGSGELISTFGSANVAIGPLTIDDGGLTRTSSMRLAWPGVDSAFRVQGVNVANRANGAYLLLINNPTSASRISLRSSNIPPPSINYARQNLTGDPMLVGYIINWTIGALSAGQAAEKTLTIVGAAVGDLVQVSSYTADGLVGLDKNYQVTADDTVKIKLVAIANGTWPAQSLTVSVRKQSGD